MKALKRKFVTSDEILKFNTSNNFAIERHFNPKYLNLENETLNLWFDYSYTKIANSIIVKVIYLDYSRKIEKYETFEFIEIFTIPLPKEGILKNNEFPIPIKIKMGTKVLWKIHFKVKPKIESDLHISLS